MFQDTAGDDRQARRRSARSGVRIAVDDFGTGYSSLGYLRRFPVDILKIAREFVVPADRDADEWAFAHAIVALGQTLGPADRRRGHRGGRPGRAAARASAASSARATILPPDESPSRLATQLVRRPRRAADAAAAAAADRRRGRSAVDAGATRSRPGPDVPPLRDRRSGSSSGSCSAVASSGLATLDFRWAPLAVAGLAVQIVLFSEPVSDRVGDLGPVIYVVSTALVLVVVIRNIRITGHADRRPRRGLEPARDRRQRRLHAGQPRRRPRRAAPRRRRTRTARSSPTPSLAPLTDIFALPAWLPFTNVFSIGDLLIGVGVAVVDRRARCGAGRTPPQPARPST